MSEAKNLEEKPKTEMDFHVEGILASTKPGKAWAWVFHLLLRLTKVGASVEMT